MLGAEAVTCQAGHGVKYIYRPAERARRLTAGGVDTLRGIIRVWLNISPIVTASFS